MGREDPTLSEKEPGGSMVSVLTGKCLACSRGGYLSPARAPTPVERARAPATLATPLPTRLAMSAVRRSGNLRDKRLKKETRRLTAPHWPSPGSTSSLSAFLSLFLSFSLSLSILSWSSTILSLSSPSRRRCSSTFAWLAAKIRSSSRPRSLSSSCGVRGEG